MHLTPESARAYLGMLGFRIVLNYHGEVVTLRYKINSDLSVQAQRGPEDTRAGIEYRRQK